MKLMCCALMLGTLSAGSAAWGAEFPYSNDFSGVGTNVDLPAEAGGSWALEGGRYRHNLTMTIGQTNGTASVPITGMTGKDFVQSTQFTVNSLSGAAGLDFFTIGFAAFAQSGAGYTSGAYYLADLMFEAEPAGTAGDVEKGRMRILSLGGTNADFVSATDNDAVGSADLVPGRTYTLKLMGSYAGNALTMTLGLYDEAGTGLIGRTVSATDATPLTGTNFGYRNASSLRSGSGAYSIDFDNFEVMVPEPAGVATLALPLWWGWRRRRVGASRC